MKKIRCKVCGTRFSPKAENRYIAEERVTGLAALTTTGTTYEAFNCPQCGCQNVVGEILPVYVFKAKTNEDHASPEN